MAKSVLGNNPLFEKHETTEKSSRTPKANNAVFTEAEVKEIEETLRGHEKFVTMSFKIREDHLKLLRDYAYTERIQVKDALENALEEFFRDKNSLLEAPEKQKQIRTKRN